MGLSEVGDGYLVRSLATTYPDGFQIGDHDHPWVSWSMAAPV